MEIDGNVHVMPDFGLAHEEASTCWCEPEIIEDALREGGCLCYLHKELQ